MAQKPIFKLPQLPKDRENQKETHTYKGINTFIYNQVENQILIGSGGYGKVYRGQHRDKAVVVKVLTDVEENDVLKEARFLHKLNHTNLVTFYGICISKKALMLEYVYFDLDCFGGEGRVSSLDNLLQELHKAVFSGFEHLVPCISRHVLSGLTYLHGQGVAHRDTKPGNVLVSNRHVICIEDPSEKQQVWSNNPCVAKLTDFGESWGQICASASVALTHTKNVCKGTPAFMAPEVIDPLLRPAEMRMEDLKLADIWSLGMLFFCLINPGNKVPYYMEAKNRQEMGNWSKFVKSQISRVVRPQVDESYNVLHSSVWISVLDAFKACIQKDPKDRISLYDLKKLLNRKDSPDVHRLNCHQGTALEDAQKAQLIGDKPTERFEVPSNDGTNSCSFLALKICERILTEKDPNLLNLVSDIEDIIQRFPEQINAVRSKDDLFEVREAYELLVSNKLISNMSVEQVMASVNVFSEAGRSQLVQSLQKEGVYVMTVPPYCFLVSCDRNSCLVVDTHVIPESLGGNYNGVVVVFKNPEETARWIWRRLAETGLKSEPQQLDEVRISACTTHRDKYSIIISDSEDSSDILVERKAESVNTGRMTFQQEWDSLEREYWGPHRIPFIPSLHNKLSNSELMALVKSSQTRTEKIPQGCRRNAVFLIESTNLKNPEDVKSDLNGVYHHCLEIKTFTVRVLSPQEGQHSVQVIKKKKLPLETPSFLHLRVHRVQNRAGLVRNISYFLDADQHLIKNTVIVQYLINKEVAGDVDCLAFTPDAHGNSKTKDRSSFYSLKKSTLSSLKDASRKRKSSQVYLDAVQEGGTDFGDAPRSKKQVIDLARDDPYSKRSIPLNEVEAILGYDAELADEGIVWFHSDVPYDMWVLGSKRMSQNLKNAAGNQPISIDPTFNHGAYEVTPVTYRHHLIESKSKNVKEEWVNAVMLGPTIIQHQKTEEAYDSALRVIVQQTGLAEAKVGIVTDGEQAIINACKKNFTKYIDLRCTNHFKENCKDLLKRIGICGDANQSPFLDVVFGEDGLVESKDKADLRARLKNVEVVLNSMEKSILDVESSTEFFMYLKEREKTVLRKLIREQRLKGGMPVDSAGVPQRVYTNQSETCNSMLASKKRSLGYAKKEDISKTLFILKVWKGVVYQQDAEIERALFGQSETLRLTKEASYLRVPVEEWYGWTKVQRQRYIDAFNQLRSEDVRNGKKIARPEQVTAEVPDKTPQRALSIKLSEALPSLLYADLIEEKAIRLLNCDGAIVISPSTEAPENRKIYLVAAEENKGHHKVTVTQQTVVCDCRGYKFVKICSHTAAIAEKESLINELVKGVKISGRSNLTYPQSSGGAGRKGHVRRRKREYLPSVGESSSSAAASRSTFSKVWHNNEPLILIAMKNIPEEKRCGFCGNDFPRGMLSIIPFDIALSHKERWEFLNRNRKSSDDPVYLQSPPNRMTTRYYCVKNACVMKRFPYFRSELLQIPEYMSITDSHKKLLRAELNVVGL